MSAEPIFMGAESRLFGVRQMPESDTQDVAVLLLNAGVLHSAGPFRLHVSLSNRLSSRGFPVFRIDLSGKGESPRRPGMDRTSSVLADFDDVYSELQAVGINRVILVGLCWGADDAILIASERDAVVGIVALDGFAFRNWRFSVWSILNRLRTRRFWKRQWLRLTGRGKQLRGRKANASFEQNIALRDWPEQNEMIRRYDVALGRGVDMLCVFTRGQDYYNHHGQLDENLRDHCDTSLLQEVFYPDTDHTFSLTDYRERLINLIDDWAGKSFSQNSARERQL